LSFQTNTNIFLINQPNNDHRNNIIISSSFRFKNNNIIHTGNKPDNDLLIIILINDQKVMTSHANSREKLINDDTAIIIAQRIHV